MITLVVTLSLLGAPEEPGQNRIDFFEKKIRPVLAERCYRCHSAEAARTGTLMGKLQLDTRAGVQRGGSRGSVVVPGRPDQSMLIEVLEYANDNLQMPPGGKLPDEWKNARLACRFSVNGALARWRKGRNRGL